MQEQDSTRECNTRYLVCGFDNHVYFICLVRCALLSPSAACSLACLSLFAKPKEEGNTRPTVTTIA